MRTDQETPEATLIHLPAETRVRCAHTGLEDKHTFLCTQFPPFSAWALHPPPGSWPPLPRPLGVHSWVWRRSSGCNELRPRPSELLLPGGPVAWDFRLSFSSVLGYFCRRLQTDMQPELAGSQLCRTGGLERRLLDTPRNHRSSLRPSKLRPRRERHCEKQPPWPGPSSFSYSCSPNSRFPRPAARVGTGRWGPAGRRRPVGGGGPSVSWRQRVRLAAQKRPPRQTHTHSSQRPNLEHTDTRPVPVLSQRLPAQLPDGAPALLECVCVCLCVFGLCVCAGDMHLCGRFCVYECACVFVFCNCVYMGICVGVSVFVGACVCMHMYLCVCKHVCIL